MSSKVGFRLEHSKVCSKSLKVHPTSTLKVHLKYISKYISKYHPLKSGFKLEIRGSSPKGE
jgi:hypothetical protein